MEEKDKKQGTQSFVFCSYKGEILCTTMPSPGAMTFEELCRGLGKNNREKEIEERFGFTVMDTDGGFIELNVHEDQPVINISEMIEQVEMQVKRHKKGE